MTSGNWIRASSGGSTHPPRPPSRSPNPADPGPGGGATGARLAGLGAAATRSCPGALSPPGLPADGLSGGLAATGVTVRVPGARLRWTNAGIRSAIFETAQPVDLPKVVAEALPTSETLACSAIARRLLGTEHDFSRNVTL